MSKIIQLRIASLSRAKKENAISVATNLIELFLPDYLLTKNINPDSLWSIEIELRNYYGEDTLDDLSDCIYDGTLPIINEHLSSENIFIEVITKTRFYFFKKKYIRICATATTTNT